MKIKNTGLAGTALKWIVMAGVASSLAACGGSSSSTPALTITGTAAQGAPLAGAGVTAVCASGTGSITADANGSYAISINNGTGPCLLTATSNGVTYHSIINSSGVADITPLTDMLTTYLATQAGTTPANILSTANGKAIIASSSAITAAESAIAGALQTNFGVTLSTTNFLTTSIVSPSAGTQSAADKDLDGLLTAGVITTSGTLQPATTTLITQISVQAPPFSATTGATGS